MTRITTSQAQNKLFRAIKKNRQKQLNCSHNIRCCGVYRSQFKAPFNDAITLPWVSFDSPNYQNVLVLDIDHQDGMELAEALPKGIRPFLVLDPRSGTSHAIFPLNTSVDLNAPKQVALAKLAIKLLAKHFNATPLGAHALHKNPFGLKQELHGKLLPPKYKMPDTFIAAHASTPFQWHTISGDTRIELTQIVKALHAEYAPYLKPLYDNTDYSESDTDSYGRNCRMFNRTRKFAYRHNIHDEAILEEKAREFSEGLPDSEIKATARSIARFMRTKYTGKQKHYKIPTTPHDTTKQLQQRGAAYARTLRTNKVKSKLKQAANALFKQGKLPQLTHHQLANLSNVSHSTARRYQDFFQTAFNTLQTKLKQKLSNRWKALKSITLKHYKTLKTLSVTSVLSPDSHTRRTAPNGMSSLMLNLMTPKPPNIPKPT